MIVQYPHVEVDTPIGLSEINNAVTKSTGTLSGIVLTSDKNLAIANARVFVKGSSIDVKTDVNGKFSV